MAVVGEAGVGKARLVDEFLQAAPAESWRVLDSAAVSYGQGTPYFPLLDLLRRYCHLEERDDVRTVAAKVTERVLTLDAALQDTLPPLLTLLDAPPTDSRFWVQLDAQQRRQLTLAALKRVLFRKSQVQPVLLVVEDLHWLDTETQALLDSLVESLPTARLLLLVTYRPEYRHGWGSKTYYTQVRLDPLPPAGTETFLQALLGNDPSLTPLTPLLVQRTEGNPFFLEESVRTLVETGALVGEPGAYRLAQGLPALHMPATVHAVLAARIDRLPPEAKQVLQTAAVLGMDIPLPVLQAVAEVDEAALHHGLAQLQGAEFLYETQLFPERAYTFKHALTQEVAYGSLLRERRRTLHARVVEVLEGLAGEGLRPAPTQSRQRVAEQAERLAEQALRSEVWDKALLYCWQAGEKAMAQSAYQEAARCFAQALEAVAHLPESRARDAQAIDLRLALRSALLPSGKTERILAVLHEAKVLAEGLDDPRRQGEVSNVLCVSFRRLGRYDQALAAGQRALISATAGGDTVLHALANDSLGTAYEMQGDYRRAVDCFRQAIASIKEGWRHERFGQVFLPAVHSRAHLAACHAELGVFAEGGALGEEGLQMAQEAAHAASLMIASWGMGVLALRQGDVARALFQLEAAMGMAREAEILASSPLIAVYLGMAYTLSGRIAEALPCLTQALVQTMSMERTDLQAFCRLSLGEAQVGTGRLEEAQVFASQALAQARAHRERSHQAYALRLLGDIATHYNPPGNEQAATSYEQALALAEELGMRPLQAHCHRDLGTLYAHMGRPEQSRASLTTAMALYRAIEMTFWLPQAEAALAQVADG